MSNKLAEPVLTQKDERSGVVKQTHPAFGVVSVSRVSGGAVLFGSEFQHANYMRLRIAKAELNRSLSSEWVSANKLPYIEVELSEAQWATFLSSANVGQGTMCTVRRIGTEVVTGIPAPERKRERFHQEAGAKLEKALAELRQLADDVGELKLSQKQKDALLSRVDQVQMNIAGNVDFVMEQFGEYMEGVEERAKIEINAYANNVISQHGRAALGGGSSDPSGALLRLGDAPMTGGPGGVDEAR